MSPPELSSTFGTCQSLQALRWEVGYMLGTTWISRGDGEAKHSNYGEHKKLPWYSETTRAFKDQILQFKLKSFSKGFMRASPGKLFASSSRSPSRGEKYRFHFCRWCNQSNSSGRRESTHPDRVGPERSLMSLQRTKAKPTTFSEKWYWGQKWAISPTTVCTLTVLFVTL